MPAVKRIISRQGAEFWDALDPSNVEEVLQAVKEDFNRPEPIKDMHYMDTISTGTPIGDSKLCYRDCLVFLLRGEFVISGQGRAMHAGCAYHVRDEAWIWLRGMTTIVVMEEGDQRGECLRATQETRQLLVDKRDGSWRVRRRAKKLLQERLQALVSSAQLSRPW